MSAPGAGALRDRYEELRARVIEGRVAGVRLGLGVFLRAGMAGWMETWSSLAPSVPVPVEPVGDRQPARAQGEIVAVLATMA